MHAFQALPRSCLPLQISALHAAHPMYRLPIATATGGAGVEVAAVTLALPGTVVPPAPFTATHPIITQATWRCHGCGSDEHTYYSIRFQCPVCTFDLCDACMVSSMHTPPPMMPASATMLRSAPLDPQEPLASLAWVNNPLAEPGMSSSSTVRLS